MPRLNHRKARTGCQRCKARKVKCDEERPKCTACARHNVPCEYAHAEASGNSQLAPPTPSTDISYNARASESRDNVGLDHALELRLMYQWTAYTYKTFATDWAFWMYQVPLIALEFRPVFDAVMALSALHASRQPPMQWVPIQGRMIPIPGLEDDPARAMQGANGLGDGPVAGTLSNKVTRAGNNAYLITKRGPEMLAVSRFYFDRAIDGHMQSLSDLSVENIENVWVAGILVLFHSVFVLSESDEDSTLPSVDPMQWMRLAKGSRFVRERWADMVGPQWWASSGLYSSSRPEMMDETTLFNTEHGRPFLKLLTYAQDYETITADDRLVYREVICYIGAVYSSIAEHHDNDGLGAWLRLIAMPSRNRPRFIDFVEAKQSRAMAILAHLFACMKLVAEKVPWFSGIAERQIPKIYENLPVAWRPMLTWPIAIMNGEIDREPTETQIDDILAL